MPITRKKFENGSFLKKRNNRNEHPVAIFLLKHYKFAFNIKEICKACKMKECTVRSFIRSLRIENKVVHKTPYFAWKVK